ncbi:MAG: nascent polypeptide-associated complex protein [Halobacteriales archaeon]|nr:nascent polypeptide-associated complex protein [Halobacteriales archaeon]
MFGGGDSRRMKKMMEQMGVSMDEIEGVEEVVIKTGTKEIVVEDATVNAIEAQGQKTYQVVGESTERSRVDEEDVSLVAEQAEVDEETARDALKKTDGDLAAAIESLK